MEPRTVAIFDFDDTLVKGDSLLPFIIGTAGFAGAALAFARAALQPLKGQPDFKTALKGAWLMYALKGRTIEETRPSAQCLKAWRKWKSLAKDAMLKHKAEGATIVVATGALDLYIRDLCDGLPVDAYLCTEMERVAGRLTGRMLGGNCVRQEKARRVQNWLESNGPFTTSYGYGNAPSDLPFLALMTHKTVI